MSSAVVILCCKACKLSSQNSNVRNAKFIKIPEFKFNAGMIIFSRSGKCGSSTERGREGIVKHTSMITCQSVGEHVVM